MQAREITTRKGYRVTINFFESTTPSNRLVIIAPATGVKQTYYKNFATHLSETGINVITFDYAGIGQSKNESLKKFDTSAFNWGNNDLEQVLIYAQNNFPDSKTTLIGHSIGGQIIGLSPSSAKVDKILLVAAQSGYWKFWKGKEKYKMWANWNLLFPTLTNLFGYMPSGKISAMEDLPKSVAQQWRKWCISPNYLFDDVQPQYLGFDKITCTIKSFSAEDDDFAPKEAVDWLALKYAKADVERVHFLPKALNVEKIGHFGFFQSRFRNTIWKVFVQEIV